MGDFNHDHNLDVATVNAGDDTVSVLLNNGGGTFQTASAYPGGSNPVALAVGDFNNDGNLDLVAANYVANTVSVLLGRGDGTFLPAVTYTSGTAQGGRGRNVDRQWSSRHHRRQCGRQRCIGLAWQWRRHVSAHRYHVQSREDSRSASRVGNFNGHLGIVTANAGDNTVSVLLGNGDELFSATGSQLQGRQRPRIDRGRQFQRSSRHRRRQPRPTIPSPCCLAWQGTFLPATAYTSARIPAGVAVGDFTNQGRIDIVAADYRKTPFRCCSAMAMVLSSPQSALPLATTRTRTAVGDFNNDGVLDIVTANVGDNSVSILLGGGKGPFQTPTAYSVDTAPSALATGPDANGNDVVVTANPEANTVSVLLGNADGTAFQSAAPTLWATTVQRHLGRR